MPRWRAARRGAWRLTPNVRSNPDTARSNPGNAPCWRADPLDLEGDGSEEVRATPGPEPQTGADFLLRQRNAQRRRVGHKGVYARLRRAMGAGTAFNANESLAYAVPTIGINARCTILGGHGARYAFPR